MIREASGGISILLTKTTAAHFVITKRDFILRGSCFCEECITGMSVAAKLALIKEVLNKTYHC